MTSLIQCAVRTLLLSTLASLRMRGSDGRTILGILEIRRRWDEVQGAFYLSSETGARVKDVPGPVLDSWIDERVTACAEVVLEHARTTTAAIDQLGIPDLLDRIRVSDVMES